MGIIIVLYGVAPSRRVTSWRMSPYRVVHVCVTVTMRWRGPGGPVVYCNDK